MKIRDISLDKKIKRVVLSCHGCDYNITSDFKGLRIEKIDLSDNECKAIRVLPRSSSSIIVC